MPSILESVTGMLGQGDTMAKLGGVLGTDASGATTAVGAAAPAILGGLADRAEEPGGLGVVKSMLDSVGGTADLGPAALFANNNGLGGSIVDSLFGSQKNQILMSLASKAGLGSGLIGKLLPMLAPVVLGAVAKQRASSALDDAGLSTLLAGERSGLSKAGLWGAGAMGAAGVAASAVGGKAAGVFGSATDTAGSAAGRVAAATRLPEVDLPEVDLPDVPEAPKGGLGWLKWLLPLLLLGLVLAFLLSQCGDDVNDAVDGAGDVVAGAADEAGDLAGDAADAVGDAADDVVDGAADAAGDAADAAGDAVDAVGDAAGDTADGATDAAGDAVDAVGDAAGDAADAAGDAASDVADGATDAADAAGDAASDAADALDAPVAGTTLNELLSLEPITFAVNSAEITTEGKTVLAEAVDFMNANPGVEVEIAGHTDSDGDDALNLALSQDRADSVKAFLVAEGIDGDRMTTRGYGESDPKVANDTPANKAINRRIEFTVQ